MACPGRAPGHRASSTERRRRDYGQYWDRGQEHGKTLVADGAHKSREAARCHRRRWRKKMGSSSRIGRATRQQRRGAGEVQGVGGEVSAGK
jgi:hypothetical protein